MKKSASSMLAFMLKSGMISKTLPVSDYAVQVQ